MQNYKTVAHIITNCFLNSYFNRIELLGALGYEDKMPDLDAFELYASTYEAAEEFAMKIE